MKSEYEKIQIAKAFLEKRGWTVTKSSAASVDAVSKFPPIQMVTKPILSTAEAAFYLNRQPQTLRLWACYGGPIAPLNIGGRLAWKTQDIRNLL